MLYPACLVVLSSAAANKLIKSGSTSLKFINLMPAICQLIFCDHRHELIDILLICMNYILVSNTFL